VYDQKGPAPLQAGDTSWLEADNGLSEGCLNLNVWAPADATNQPLPVIVYIFGGGFEFGTNTQTTSNASGLAATGRDWPRRWRGSELSVRLLWIAFALPVRRGICRGDQPLAPGHYHCAPVGAG